MRQRHAVHVLAMVAIYLTCGATASLQSNTLTITLKDAATRTGVSGVLVMLQGLGPQPDLLRQNSNSLGVCVFSDLAPGAFEIVIDPLLEDYAVPAPHFVKVPDTVSREIRLFRPVIVKGKVVTDTGSPIANADVLGNSFDPVSVSRVSVNTITKDDGTYILAGLQAGMKAVITVKPPANYYRARRIDLPVAGELTGIDFSVKPIDPTKVSVTGTVKINGSLVRVKIITIRSTDSSLGNAAETHDDGRYTFYDLPTGTYTVKVELVEVTGGTAPSERQITVTAGQTTVADFDLTTP